MAGSYDHLRNDDTGAFRFDLIENLGDAHEACEECFYIIDWLTGGDQSKVKAALADYYADKPSPTNVLPNGLVA